MVLLSRKRVTKALIRLRMQQNKGVSSRIDTHIIQKYDIFFSNGMAQLTSIKVRVPCTNFATGQICDLLDLRCIL